MSGNWDNFTLNAPILGVISQMQNGQTIGANTD
jgi:hypothetical protein